MAALKCTCILLLITIFSTGAQEQKYRVCAKRGFDHDCSQLSRTLEAECIENLHGIDCMQNIEQGISDFGRVTPEEALIAANFLQDVVVIGEIRSDAIYDDALYSTVVLVKQDSGGFSNLRGKKLCHPGFKYDETVSELMLKEFERTVLKANNADACLSGVNTDTVDERELKAVYEFFGPSCRPGPWSILDNYNKDFYSRYGRLCELCNSQEKCDVPNGVAPFMYSLECLLKVDGGDVALTTLNTVKEYFERQENQAKKALYRYLCRDGSIKPLDTPCIWSKQPWNLIVAKKKHAADIKSSIEQKWLPSNIIVLPNNASVGVGSSGVKSQLEDALKGLFFLEKGSNKILIVNEVPLQKYITGFRSIPNIKESTSCGQQIRWCTISDDEQQKCLWLAQASLGRAIQPVIDCVRSINKLTCLEDIEKNKADIVTSDAHYGYIARKKGLAPIAYPDTDPKNVIHTLLIIKNKDAASIQKFGDLKDKKACFPEYGGIEWLSFINAGRNQNALSSICDYGGLISNFVGDSCIPGAHDPEHEVSSATDKDKLCRLCLPISTGTAVTCNTDSTNLYYGNNGTLKCLREVGDFAVITKGEYTNVDPNEFRVLCQNGTLAATPGFNVDPSCPLSVTVDSEVVTKRKQPNKNKDVELVLLNFERRFGTDRTKAFEVFNIFNNKKDLLFKDSTPGLVKTDSDTVYVKNYANMFAHTDQCVQESKPGENTPPGDDPGGANALQTPIATIIFTLVLLFISKLLS